MSSKLSIIIPTFNSFANKQGSLELTLTSILKSKTDTYEIVIVDDGSNDNTADYLNKLLDFKNSFDVKVISKEHDGNRGKSRNIGAQRSSGELLLFIDDDIILLSDDTLENVLKIWKKKRFMCGARRFWTHPIWDREYILTLIHKSNYNGIKNRGFVPKGLNRYNGCRDLLEFSFLSNFGLVHREDFFAAGGFDDEYTGWGYEETDLMFRLLQRGVEFVNLWSSIDILHLNHPLGKSEADMTSKNRKRYYSKTSETGVIFKVNHLFGVFENDGSEIFQRIGCSVERGKQLNSPTSVEYENWREIGTDSKVRQHFIGSSSDPIISVIIPTHNSFALKKGSIEVVLASLENQVLRDYEVIVIDDGSNDQTIDFLKDYSQRELPFNFKYISQRYCGNRANCRNIGARKAKSSLLLFLDDDTIFLSDDAIKRVINAYKPKHFLCGAKRYWSYVTWDRNLFLYAVRKQNYEKLKAKYILPVGINRRMGFRDLFEYSFLANCGVVAKTDFENVGGFDEVTFSGWGREDVDLMLRLYLNRVYFINLHNWVSVLHLNHPIREEDARNREASFKKYETREREYGYIFKINHLFGVFEKDGDDILIPYRKSKQLSTNHFESKEGN